MRFRAPIPGSKVVIESGDFMDRYDRRRYATCLNLDVSRILLSKDAARMINYEVAYAMNGLIDLIRKDMGLDSNEE